MSCMPGVTRGIERIRCNVVMWHDVIWGGMTCNGHGARICGDDRWYLSLDLSFGAALLCKSDYH
jgi:hypothetical protein